MGDSISSCSQRGNVNSVPQGGANDHPKTERSEFISLLTVASSNCLIARIRFNGDAGAARAYREGLVSKVVGVTSASADSAVGPEAIPRKMFRGIHSSALYVCSRSSFALHSERPPRVAQLSHLVQM
jgi:hypothetical protein